MVELNLLPSILLKFYMIFSATQQSLKMVPDDAKKSMLANAQNFILASNNLHELSCVSFHPEASHLLTLLSVWQERVSEAYTDRVHWVQNKMT